jgi:hypothetical protein
MVSFMVFYSSNKKHTDVEATWYERADHKAYPQSAFTREEGCQMVDQSDIYAGVLENYVHYECLVRPYNYILSQQRFSCVVRSQLTMSI